MCVHTQACMLVCACVHVYVYVCVYLCECMCMDVRVCKNVCARVCVYMRARACMPACAYVHMFVYGCLCVHSSFLPKIWSKTARSKRITPVVAAPFWNSPFYAHIRTWTPDRWSSCLVSCDQGSGGAYVVGQWHVQYLF